MKSPGRSFAFLFIFVGQDLRDEEENGLRESGQGIATVTHDFGTPSWARRLSAHVGA
jgi:hypothetical protein